MTNDSSNGVGREPLRQRALALRKAVLVLHKALIDSERVTFEKTMGSIPSPTHFLQLLTSDPWFTWLQPLSTLIVSMDEKLALDEPLTIEDIKTLINRSAQLLAPAEHGEGFSGHYYEALQRDPDVVLAHAETIRILGSMKPKPGHAT